MGPQLLSHMYAYVIISSANTSFEKNKKGPHTKWLLIIQISNLIPQVNDSETKDQSLKDCLSNTPQNKLIET